MRKKTAVHAKKCQADSPSKKSGLIAKGKSSQQSAMTESVLDNRSHRTTLQISCKRAPSQFLDAHEFIDITMRKNRQLPQRLTASFAC